jgi:hypothetical protein
MRIKQTVLPLLMIMLTSAPLAAQALPPGKDVVAKYIEATGGRAAHENVKTRIMHSTIDIPAMNIKGTSVAYAKAPNLAHVEADIEAVGKEVRGSDGTVFWEITTTSGPRIFKDEEYMFWGRSFAIESDLDLEKFYKSVETKSIETVDGKQTYKVAFTAHGGNVETRYYDKDTGLLVKMEQEVPTAFGKIPISSMPTDYRDVGGLKMPHKVIETIAGAQQVVVTIQKVEINPQIPEAKFQLPAEIKAIVPPTGATTAPAR